MHRTIKYPLYPTKEQNKFLFFCLHVTRELYNASLQERRDAWENEKKSISCHDQQEALTQKRKMDAKLSQVPATILRGTSLRRIELGFQAFFRRAKAGEKPGYPRFKNAKRWDSLIDDRPLRSSPIIGNRIKIPGIGKVKAKIHRPLEGTPKTLALKLHCGKWYACIGCDKVPTRPLPATGKEIGIDLGLTRYITTTDDEQNAENPLFDNPRPLKTARLKLERAHRRVSRRKKGSGRWKKAVALLAKHYAKVANIRREHHIALANFLVKHYDRICIEKLNIKGLASGMLAKSVNDAAWGSFVHWMNCKAESAGRVVIEVDPRGTSQRCSQCDNVVEKKLSERIHSCANCGLILDRDVNAARNILRLGLSQRRDAAAVSAHHRPAKFTEKAQDDLRGIGFEISAVLSTAK